MEKKKNNKETWLHAAVVITVVAAGIYFYKKL